MSAGKADPNAQLNAVTNTRGTLLGILTPMVIVAGGIVAFLNYLEARGQNQRTNDLALAEREEIRRVRRADVYAEFLSACHTCYHASVRLYLAEREGNDYASLLEINLAKRLAMDLAHERVMMLGSDSVEHAATMLYIVLGTEIATHAGDKPKLSNEEWKRLVVTEHAKRKGAFLAAARNDLAPTKFRTLLAEAMARDEPAPSQSPSTTNTHPEQQP